MKFFSSSLATLVLSVWLLGSVNFVAAANPKALDRAFSDDFVIESDIFRGRWRDRETWDGFWCDGFYAYDVSLTGKIRKVDFDLDEEGGVKVRAMFENMYARASGRYKSSYSACWTLSSGVAADVNWVDVDAYVEFVGNTPDDIKLKIRIVKTQFGRVSFSQYLPEWFEYFLTSVINRAVKDLWKSKLGDLIEEKLSEYLSEKFPTH